MCEISMKLRDSSHSFEVRVQCFDLKNVDTIEKVLTREETLGRFLYKRRDSTSTICLPDFLKIKTNKKLIADVILNLECKKIWSLGMCE